MRNVPEFLSVLLNGEADSQEFRLAEQELERRPELQSLLEELAIGDSDWWNEARSTLAETGLPEDTSSTCSSIVIELDSTAGTYEEGAVPQIDVERLSLDFLDPPAHPELLGRFGRYDVEKVLGSGGMGVVLRAFDGDLHRVVAIKVLAPHLAHSTSARRRFSREAQAAAAVVHPNVIQIYNVDAELKVPYLVMQYVPGESLQRRVESQGSLPVPEALRIASQTAAGLAAAHAQGLVHRDVKPANILLEEHVERVLLSDFGLARAVDDASLTRTGIVAGTPHYMSPEQASGEAIDHRSDLFSLGSVIYFMLAGRPPFRASGAMAVLHRICQSEHRRLTQVNPEVPVELSNLVDRCLSKEVGPRYQSAQEVAQELESLLSDYQLGRLSLRKSEHGTANNKPAGEFALGHIPRGLLKSAAVVVLAVCGFFALGTWARYQFDWGQNAIGSRKDMQESQSETLDESAPATASAEPSSEQTRSHWEEMQAAEQAYFELVSQTQSDANRLMEELQQPNYPTSTDPFQSEVASMQAAIDALQSGL